MTTTSPAAERLPQRLPQRLRAAATRDAAIAYLAGGGIAIGIYFLLPADPQGILYVAIGLSAVTAIVVGSQKLGAERLAWRLFALGILCEVAGDAYSSYYEIHLNGEPPLPSVGDAFYLSGYPVLALGILLLLRRRGGSTTRIGVLDTLIVFAAVATAQWMFFVEPHRHMGDGIGAEIVSMTYPSMDVLLLVGLAQLMLGGRRVFASWLLVASVGLWIIGDEVFALTDYAAGGWVDTFWLASYVVWGAAALAIPAGGTPMHGERRGIPRLTHGRLALLATAVMAVPVALVLERELRQRSHPIAAAIGSAVIAVLVLVRLVGLVRAADHARLGERKARHEADLARERIEEQAQNATLRDLDRLKDELLSSVSHELRTPLTSISGYVELLLEETRDPQQHRHLEIVQRNTARLLGLVSDLLLAARLQSGQMELHLAPVDLRLLVEQAAEAARPHAAAAQVGLRVRLEEVPPVSGERDRLAQVLDNLVSNAIKFTPAGGEVEVALGSHNGEVSIEVSDTGIGLAEDELAQLFTRFYRARSAVDAQVPGTGLGLFIAKGIVDAHGGRISVRSSIGKGTTFAVALPSA